MKPATTTTSLASSLSLSKGVALLAAILLVACSDDSATEKIVEVAGDGIEVVSDVSQLPACSSKNDMCRATADCIHGNPAHPVRSMLAWHSHG